MKEMTQEQKKECRRNYYMHSENCICNENACKDCKFTYEYVRAYDDGYTDSCEDNWHA